MTKRTVTLVVAAAIAAVTLAACGTPSASHVVKGTVSTVVTTTAAPVPSTTVPDAASTTAAASTTPPSNALSSQTLDQVGAELGSLDNSLNAANADLNNPQGDN